MAAAVMDNKRGPIAAYYTRKLTALVKTSQSKKETINNKPGIALEDRYKLMHAELDRVLGGIQQIIRDEPKNPKEGS